MQPIFLQGSNSEWDPLQTQSLEAKPKSPAPICSHSFKPFLHNLHILTIYPLYILFFPFPLLSHSSSSFSFSFLPFSYPSLFFPSHPSHYFNFPLFTYSFLAFVSNPSPSIPIPPVPSLSFHSPPLFMPSFRIPPLPSHSYLLIIPFPSLPSSFRSFFSNPSPPFPFLHTHHSLSLNSPPLSMLSFPIPPLPFPFLPTHPSFSIPSLYFPCLLF